MARGWESKSVEVQQEEKVRAGRPTGRPETPDERARRSERGTLSLSRKRAVADLQRATTGAHRQMLEHAIADLDRRIAALSPDGSAKADAGN